MTDRDLPADRGTARTDRQRFRGDDRAVSAVLGSVLMFGLAVLLVALVQLNAVPAANQQVEFEHNQRAQGDMQEFQEVLTRTAATGVEGTVKIEAGTGYPTRLFLFNPPRATGSLDLSESGTATLDNARAAGEAGDYLNGTERSFATKSVRYQPNYNEYRNAPTTVYENGVLYNRYESDQSLVQERGALVSGRRISVVALQGRLSTASAHSVSVGVTPVSGPARTVSVADDGTPITLTVPTELSVDDWEAILDDERTANGGYVADIRPGPDEGTVTIELQQGVTYDLRLAALGLGSDFERTTAPQYLVDVGESRSTVPENTTQQFTVEVRDRYNNPVSDVAVTATASQGTVTPVETNRSDSDGRVTLSYETPADVDETTPVTITASFNGTAPAAQREVVLERSVFDADGSGSDGDGGNTVNPGTGQSVALVDSELVGGTCSSRNQDCVADLTFQNLDATAGRSVSRLRVSFYSAQGDAPPETYTVSDSPSGPTATGDVGGRFRNVSVTPLAAADGAAGGPDERTYRFAFDFSGNRDGVKRGDFFAVEIIYEDDAGRRSTATYFGAPD
ncbi:Ig-like domain-containing protein [Halorientalis salina]|uniref:Ig-like domain-containing protein n=1 Tax=Halorientalis salina TaxID=2932266 RepID=UPI0010AD4BA8|nr:Ig-like domain-containing protein [Halorientalis salina]